MFKNYLKIAFRNVIKYNIHSFINISGLAIGMACSILIFLWIQHELSFDKFHEHINELYQVPTRQHYGNEILLAAGAPPALGPALKKDFPVILMPMFCATLSATLCWERRRWEILASIFLTQTPHIKTSPA